MKKINYLITLVLYVSVFSLAGLCASTDSIKPVIKNIKSEILELSKFSDIDKFLSNKKLIILDIDNTLIKSAQQLGSEEWFRFRTKYYQEQGLLAQVALERALPEWIALQNISMSLLVEADIPKIIEKIQKKRIPIIGMTHRGMSLSTRTTYQLASLGIDLSKSAPIHNDFPIKMGKSYIIFRNGVLFTSGAHKGLALSNLFKAMNFKPDEILYVDDEIGPLNTIAKTCKEKFKVDFTGLRYSFMDKIKKEFDPEIANTQFARFSAIMTDDEAKKIVKQKNDSK